ncbi:MAG: response regulator transcription factor, partial [Oscillospiraceae bacterium]|nr:response regulator transcription factor [Oscillospiraceae bacterium]
TRTAGIDAIEVIRGRHPEIKCIILTVHEDDEYLFRAYLVGAADYIIKTNEPEKIIKSIYDVNLNQLLLRPEVAQKIVGEYKRIQSTHSQMKDTLQMMMKISTAEYEILRMIYDGHSYKNIAGLRCVEETTIRSQVNHILKKFGKKRMKHVIEELRESQVFEYSN